MQQTLFQLLQARFNPYEDNSALEAQMFEWTIDIPISYSAKIKTKQKEHTSSEITHEPEEISIVKAIAMGLNLKERLKNKNSFSWSSEKRTYNNKNLHYLRTPFIKFSLF